MKRTPGRQILNLIFYFFLVAGVAALGTQALAEEYYTYQDANGKLVISNKKPPAGSKILKTQELPESAEGENGKAAKVPAAPNTETGSEKTKQ